MPRVTKERIFCLANNFFTKKCSSIRDFFSIIRDFFFKSANFLATKAKTTEKAVIEKYANVQGKQRSKDSRQRVKFVVEAFHTMPKADYIQTLAHDQQKINNDK